VKRYCRRTNTTVETYWAIPGHSTSTSASSPSAIPSDHQGSIEHRAMQHYNATWQCENHAVVRGKIMLERWIFARLMRGADASVGHQFATQDVASFLRLPHPLMVPKKQRMEVFLIRRQQILSSVEDGQPRLLPLRWLRDSDSLLDSLDEVRYRQESSNGAAQGEQATPHQIAPDRWQGTA
jgi:hypothetical protein